MTDTSRPSFATVPGRAASACNARSVGRLDIPGGGQVVVEDGYAYVGHMRPPCGTSIIDVRDPKNPRVVAEIAPPGERSHTHKVRVVGDLLIANVEQDRRHFFRKAERLDAVTEALAARLGRQPGNAEIAEELGVAAGDLDELRASRNQSYDEGGFRLFDISDRANPRLVHYQKTAGVGVHRFDMDARYAYISTAMEGYRGNILVIYDIADPAAPREVGRWHMPGQHVAGGETPHWKGLTHRLHHALADGNELWAACWYAGAYVIDRTDITAPRTIAHHNYHPPFPEPTHTFLRLPQPIDGRRIALAIDEEHDHVPGQPHGFLWIFDVTDLSRIEPVSTFHVSALENHFSDRPGRFGAHQFDEKIRGTLIHATWFAGGLRVIDVANPETPREIAHYVPEPLGDEPAPQSNDVAVDDRGLIYVIDRNRGLDILALET